MDSSDDQALVFRNGNRFLKQAHTDPTSFTQGPREHATAFVFTGVQTMVPSSAPLPSLFHPGQFSILYGEWLQVLHSPGLLWSGQGMERTQFSPPSFANHSSVYAPLDYFSVLEKYLSFYMLHGHFTLSMSLKFAPPNQTPLQLHAQARYLGMDWTASPTHPQILDSSLIFLELTSYLLPFLSQAPLAPAWMMMSKLQSDLITASPFHGSTALGIKTQLFTMDDQALHGVSPVDYLALSALCSRLQASASAIPSARYTPPASPYLLPRSLPHSLQLSNQRSLQGNFP